MRKVRKEISVASCEWALETVNSIQNEVNTVLGNKIWRVLVKNNIICKQFTYYSTTREISQKFPFLFSIFIHYSKCQSIINYHFYLDNSDNYDFILSVSVVVSD